MIPIGAGLELRLRCAAFPVPPQLPELVAQAEVRSLAVRQAAAGGLTGDPFVERWSALSDSIESSPGYESRVRELAAQGEQFYRDAHGIAYLQGTDPYRWLRRARNIAARGHFGESEHDGRGWNDLTGVPGGVPADGNLEALSVGLTARLLRPLGGPSLEAILYWSPVAIVSLALAVSALVGNALAGPWAGLFAATLLAFQASVAERTTAGYADTDAWNLVLALAMLGLLGAYLAARVTRRAIALGALAALVVGVFAWNWPGWWFVFASLVAGLVGASVLALVALRAPAANRNTGPNRPKSPPTGKLPQAGTSFDGETSARILVLRSALFLVAAVASVALLAGPSRLAGLWRESLASLGLGTVTLGDAWPNVYNSVGELQPVSFDRLRIGVGGDLVLGVAIAAIFGLVAGPVRARSLALLSVVGFALVGLGSRLAPDHGLAILIASVCIAAVGGLAVALLKRRAVRPIPLSLAAWSLLALVACSRGSRFVFLLAPPLAIAAGTLLGTLFASALTAVRSARSTLLRVGGSLAAVAVVVTIFVNVRQKSMQTILQLQALPEMNDAWAASFDWLRTNSDPRAVVCAWWDYGDMITALAGRRVLNDAGSQATSIAYWMSRVLATEDPSEARAILRLLCTGGQEGYDALRGCGIPAARAVEQLVELARLPGSEVAAHLRSAGVPESTAQAVTRPFLAPLPEAYLWLTEDLSGKTASWAQYGNWDFVKAMTRSPDVEMHPALVCTEVPGGILTETGARIEVPTPGWTGLMRAGRGPSIAVVRRRGFPRALSLPPSIARSLYVRLMYESRNGVPPFELAGESETFLGERVALYRIRW